MSREGGREKRRKGGREGGAGTNRKYLTHTQHTHTHVSVFTPTVNTNVLSVSDTFASEANLHSVLTEGRL